MVLRPSARAILADKKILLLDEATSALDSETEQIIQQSIDELHGQKTMIIIAHRLSTIKKCDKIFVLDQGEIKESGTHNELLSIDGYYKVYNEIIVQNILAFPHDMAKG